MSNYMKWNAKPTASAVTEVIRNINSVSEFHSAAYFDRQLIDYSWKIYTFYISFSTQFTSNLSLLLEDTPATSTSSSLLLA